MLPGETLAHYRALPDYIRAARVDGAWAAGQVGDMPTSWADKLLTRWRGQYSGDAAAANAEHLQQCERIKRAHRAGIAADAGDAELCELADTSAREADRRIGEARQRAATVAVFTFDAPRAMDAQALRVVGDTWALCALAAWFAALGLADDWAATVRKSSSVGAALARAKCGRWWRRVLRRLHALAVESTARGIGLVHKRAGCYASNESVNRRAAQNARNAAVLDAVKAENEHGQRRTLAELAATGPANREIRRHELMTRIAGFELIAKECGNAALFVTLTCPSRMHAYRSKPGSKWAVEPNPKHDGTRPDDAQKYLAKQWARFRAAAARAGFGLYGFRIAEPNHDGTPHWHALLFVRRVDGVLGCRLAEQVGGGDDLVQLLRRYFLANDSSDERGAEQHRVKVEVIDWNKGSAASYIAKYVAKNIDGYKVEKDLYGNDCLTASRRVDAWASTWRIRQFQQVGGAPVTTWREMRRLHPEQDQTAHTIALGLDAVNAGAWGLETERDEKGRQVAAHGEAVRQYSAATAWAAYLELQGGPVVKRAALRLRVWRESTGEIGRYGEPVAPRAVGVLTVEKLREVLPAFGIVPERVRVSDVAHIVEAERAVWRIVPPGEALPDGEAVRPWSPVNNCTPDPFAQAFALRYGPAVKRFPKLGRWAKWRKKSESERGRTEQPLKERSP